MAEDRIMGVTINVQCKAEDELVRVGEILNRAAAGLALDGFTASINYINIPDEDSDKD